VHPDVRLNVYERIVLISPIENCCNDFSLGTAQDPLGNDEIRLTERQSQYGDVVLLAELLRSLGDCLC
jgi:hypothetical protein